MNKIFADEKGQAAVGYVLAAIIAFTIAVIFCSPTMRNALGVLYQNAATRVIQSGIPPKT